MKHSLGKHGAGGRPASLVTSFCPLPQQGHQLRSTVQVCGISGQLNKALGSVGPEVRGAAGGALRAFLSLPKGYAKPLLTATGSYLTQVPAMLTWVCPGSPASASLDLWLKDVALFESSPTACRQEGISIWWVNLKPQRGEGTLWLGV